MEALEILRQEGLDIPLILVSGALGAVTAVECIKQGVTDYVLKDSLARLSVALRGALKDKKARQERKRAASLPGRESRGTGPLQRRPGTVRLRGVARLAGTSAHGFGLHPAVGGTLSRQTRRTSRQIYRLCRRRRHAHAKSDPGLAGFFPRGAAGDTRSKITDCNEMVDSAVENLQAAILESGAAVTHGPLPRLMANGSQLNRCFRT